ncbi:Os07g0606000 [Oryza sativa Japonica Group]|uniref:Os07g0606000 protein n=2 Tax=Oryza sativa subsp. japonica TaxID=39947 RepID=Q69RF7_ORYSJ|nr:unknown protein [Oryza sativa Japonica Group]BAF22142.1 Os07g0606000 [Oryza sativa Japonica Group]|eukprot:NP_001060228.1 Os07g0606000 [Oryza sativa Japonica Group]
MPSKSAAGRSISGEVVSWFAGAAPAAPRRRCGRRLRSPLPPLGSRGGEEDRPPLPRRRRPREARRHREADPFHLQPRRSSPSIAAFIHRHHPRDRRSEVKTVRPRLLPLVAGKPSPSSTQGRRLWSSSPAISLAVCRRISGACRFRRCEGSRVRRKYSRRLIEDRLLQVEEKESRRRRRLAYTPVELPVGVEPELR